MRTHFRYRNKGFLLYVESNSELGLLHLIDDSLCCLRDRFPVFKTDQKMCSYFDFSLDPIVT